MKRFNSSLLLWVGLATLISFVFVSVPGWSASPGSAGDARQQIPAAQNAKTDSQASSLTKIEKIEVIDLTNAYRVKITTNRPATYSVFKHSQPDEIVVNLPDTLPDKAAGIPDKLDNDLIGEIKHATIEKHGKSATQISITLKHDAGYDTTNKAENLFIDIVKPQKFTENKASLVTQTQAPTKVNLQYGLSQGSQNLQKVSEGKQVSSKNSINDVKIVETDAGYQISIIADSAISKYKPFTLTKPNRLAIDFPMTKCLVASPVHTLNNSDINTVRVGSTDDAVRCVIDFFGTIIPHYQINQKENELTITVFSQKKASAPDKKAAELTAAKTFGTESSAVQKATPEPAHKTIETGEVKPAPVKAATSSKIEPPKPEHKPAPEMVQPAPQKATVIKKSIPPLVVVEVTKPKIESSKREQIPTTGPLKVSPQQTVETKEVKTTRKIVETPKSETPKPEQKPVPDPLQPAPQNATVTREIKSTQEVKPSIESNKFEGRQEIETSKPIAEETAISGDLPQTPAQKISLDFKDADIKNILRLIAEVSGFNIITSDRVTGKITLKIENIPWDQALDIILETNNLGKLVSGNIIRIDTKDQILRSQKDKIEQTSLEDLVMESIPVSYVKARDIERYIKDLKILSDKRGTINSFEHTNQVTITDVPDKVKKIKELIREQDVPTRQVLIEARIVQSNPSYVKELGVIWGSFYNTVNNGGKAKGGADVAVSGAAGGGTVINLPAPIGLGSGGGINFGYVTNSLQLDVQLSALEKNEKLKIVSSPKVLSLDNKEARIKQGVALPYLKLSEQGVTSTEFKDAVLELKVTPKITPANTINLHVFITKNQKSAQTGAGGEPGIDVREVETDLLVETGKTVVIGGIYENTKNHIVNGVPFFSKIPVFGYFFRNTRTEDLLTELLVFLTVSVVNQPQVAAQANPQIERGK